MTTPSQHINISFKVNLRLLEHSARVVGFLAVAAPLLLIAKGISGAVPQQHRLPLIYQEPNAERYATVDDRELDCLAANIYWEARNQPQIGQLAVGITTLVRAREARWPDSICKVVKQPKQFSWVNAEYKQRGRATAADMAYLHALDMASGILQGEYDNVLSIFYPTHYHTTAVNPSWSRKMAKLALINDHIFYE